MTPECSKVQEVMSAYFDGELLSAERTAVDRHLEECDVCAHVLAEFRSLSTLSQSLRNAEAKPSLRSFDALELAGKGKSIGHVRRTVTVAAACASLVLMGVAIAAWQFGFLSMHGSHESETAAVRAYLREFPSDPSRAQQKLMSAYAGKEVTVGEAARQFKHSLIAAKAPPGYRIATTTVFEFPCCRCIQTVFAREGGSPVVVLEHTTEQSVWFADRPTIDAVCDGVSCRIVQLDGMLASTWRLPSHQVTLIGLKDLAELNIWITFLNDQSLGP
jgi:hypothetical protein